MLTIDDRSVIVSAGLEKFCRFEDPLLVGFTIHSDYGSGK